MENKEYYIGDLCYVLDENTNNELFGLVQNDPLIEGKFVTLKDGRKFFLGSTAHGDGGYLGSDGNEYSVDSGTIGIVAIDDIKNEEKFNYKMPNKLANGKPHPFAGKLYYESLGHIHNMTDESFNSSMSSGGCFKFGDVRIITI